MNISLTAVEYRSVIKFLLLRGKNPSEIIEELKLAYGDSAPSRTTTYDWIKQFKGGRTSVEDDKSTGRPLEIGESHEQKLCQIIQNERRITKQELAVRLNVSYGTVFNLMKQLGIRKLCSRFVPYFLTHEMCQRRKECCEINLKTLEEVGQHMLHNIITEDETPLSLYLPDDRRTSKEFKFPGETATRKLRTGTSHRRSMMLTVFWDAHGVVLIDFADKSIKINAQYYSNLLAESRKKRRKPRGQQMFFLHDNAPIHTAEVTKQTIHATDFSLLPHPPYSPDLAPSDFYLFRALKKHLRGKRFESQNALKECTMEFFDSQQPQFYECAFQQLVERWRKCVEHEGSYIEKL